MARLPGGYGASPTFFFLIGVRNRLKRGAQLAVDLHARPKERPAYYQGNETSDQEVGGAATREVNEGP